MPAFVNVRIHSSQFPEAVRRDLLDSLRNRAVNHKFHFDSVKQSGKWLSLHKACSPAASSQAAGTYVPAFEHTAKMLGPGPVHVVGLGCADAYKECALIRRLEGRAVQFTPVDVSAALVISAWQAAGELIPTGRCFPLVCDLATAEDLPEIIRGAAEMQGTPCLITLFGMLPNFPPETLLPKLAALAKPGEVILCSANLAPGEDYRKGVEQVLPLYDNELTRDWLWMFLSGLDIGHDDGAMDFCIEEHPSGSGFLRIAAYLRFLRHRAVQIDSEEFIFQPGDALRLFYSYRHTPALVERLLKPHRFALLAQWISPCGEEGVFLARRY
jgi:uncharacterized SAM-dependent methyltransferase